MNSAATNLPAAGRVPLTQRKRVMSDRISGVFLVGERPRDQSIGPDAGLR
jgi:hypothetical protein